MIDCDAYRNERTQLYESLSKLCMNFNNLNSNEDSIVINEVLKYIYTCYNKRFDILKKHNINTCIVEFKQNNHLPSKHLMLYQRWPNVGP